GLRHRAHRERCRSRQSHCLIFIPTERTDPMKKFVNDPAKFVPEFMKGIALANPDLLDFNAEFQMITRKGGAQAGKVSIVQGSGSGHEPAHVMAVGPGMLTGACRGAVLAAPPAPASYQPVQRGP